MHGESSCAEEIQTACYGERLDGLLRARKQSLFGLLNGIDVVDYNPATDKALTANYTPDDLSGKAVYKRRCRSSAEGGPPTYRSSAWWAA